MKRFVIHLVVAIITFSAGAAGRLLTRHTPHRETLSTLKPGASPGPLSGIPLPDELVCDYDVTKFNPRGDYFILGRKPKHFREFDSLELAVGQARAYGVAVLQTYSDGTYYSYYAVSGSITRNRLTIVAIPFSDGNFEYSFEGNFLRDGIVSDAGRNEAVLKGKLTKSKHGVRIAECEVRFRVEYLGC